MNVKGNAFLARKSLVTTAFGEDPWRGFMEEYAQKDPFFTTTIYSLTQIPAEKFIAFNDSVMERFYPGKDEAEVLWAVGEKSCEYALGEGQLRGIFKPGEYERFMRFAPNIWKGYYSEGEARLHPQSSDTIDLQVVGVPAHLRHGYFEFVAIAFIKRGLELLGATVKTEILKGFSKGDDEVCYRYTFR